ncbi:adenine deaminase C-terminal domain-containing protein [Meiothermus sp.]|uniref:adenine deaminase C-terminal domain-containing protein n=1 Tax=Meiothermus sp. TaxID=1955249 RepID=UPI00307DBF4D
MKPLDLLIHNVQIADVVRLRLYLGWVGIAQGQFQYVEEGPPPTHLQAQQILDGQGQTLTPGLIDSHMHIESSLATPRRFAEAVLPHGTTSVLADPHEMANVLGAAGVRYMVEAAQGLPLRVFTAIPSCVPATDELETALGSITAEDVRALTQLPGVIALGELMDYQGLARGSQRLKRLIETAREAGLLLEGHTPTLGGTILSDYAAHGITSDHTLSTPEKLLEQLTKGFTVMLQEKSLNAAVVEAVRGLPDRSRVLLITDDVMPNRLVSGHLSRIVQLAISLGWPAMDALASATLRPAMYLRRPELGLIAPGRKADFLLMESLSAFPPRAVYVEGVEVARSGQSTFALPSPLPSPTGGELKRPGFRPEDFQFPIADGSHPTRVIRMNPQNSFTRLETHTTTFKSREPTDPPLATIGVFQRQGHRPGALGLLAGLGLRSGAFASSLAHDSHHLLVVGRSTQRLAQAANALLVLGGGMVFADAEQTLTLPLPIAGLISDAPTSEVAVAFDNIENALRANGVNHKNPVLFLTLLALTVSPEVKMSDLGLVDVEARRIIPLFEQSP